MAAPSKLLVVLALSVLSAAGFAAPLHGGDEIRLWGEALPAGSANPAVIPKPLPPQSNDVAGITHPSLTAFVPDKPNGVSVVVIPGGSYTKLVVLKEGQTIAKWLNTQGITAFVLRHRLPDEGHANGRSVVLQDGQRALRLVRQHAAEWGLDPAKIGVMGFSAGGNLAAALGTAFEQVSYPAGDAADALSARPDFMALIYPAVGFTAAHGVRGTSESRAAFSEYATDEIPQLKTPPAFMVIAADDSLARNAVRFWQALAQAGNPPELHVPALGGHGFALKDDAAPSVRAWPTWFQTWLQARKIVTP